MFGFYYLNSLCIALSIMSYFFLPLSNFPSINAYSLPVPSPQILHVHVLRSPTTLGPNNPLHNIFRSSAALLALLNNINFRLASFCFSFVPESVNSPAPTIFSPLFIRNHLLDNLILKTFSPIPLYNLNRLVLKSYQWLSRSHHSDFLSKSQPCLGSSLSAIRSRRLLLRFGDFPKRGVARQLMHSHPFAKYNGWRA